MIGKIVSLSLITIFFNSSAWAIDLSLLGLGERTQYDRIQDIFMGQHSNYRGYSGTNTVEEVFIAKDSYRFSGNCFNNSEPNQPIPTSFTFTKEEKNSWWPSQVSVFTNDANIAGVGPSKKFEASPERNNIVPDYYTNYRSISDRNARIRVRQKRSAANDVQTLLILVVSETTFSLNKIYFCEVKPVDPK